MKDIKKRLVVIDDEKYVCNIIVEALSEFPDYEVSKFNDPVKATQYLEENPVDLVLTDLVMGDHSGVQIMETTLKNHPDAVVILMTGYPTVKTAISVLKQGGYDYLVKPFKLEDLKSTIIRGLEHQSIKRENVQLKSQLELRKISDAVVGGIKLRSLLSLIAESIISELSADAVSIILLDRKAQKYRVRCLTSLVDDKKLLPFLLGEQYDGAEADKYIKARTINEELTVGNKTHWRSYISYPLLSKGKNIGFLNLVCTNRFGHLIAGQKHLVALLATTAASAVESNYLDRNLQLSYLMTIRALAKAIEARDGYTAGHTDRVYRLARVIALKLGWNGTQLSDLRTGSILHDIGKIGVPDRILNKPGKLSDEEFEIMKQHPEMGAKILQNIPFLEQVIPYVLYHHEKYDGTGYPFGLSGKEIPIEGRILAVADTFDAILSDRPYRNGATTDKALDELVKFKGMQFDPKIVDLFIKAFNESKSNWLVSYGKNFKDTETKQNQKVSV
ncbi:MAG: HD domain-containing phosphohydrolase [Candidatus Zixiibacteriota bacterium]